MTIEQYAKEYKEIKWMYANGWIAYNESLDKHMELNKRYLKGKVSMLLPVV